MDQCCRKKFTDHCKENDQMCQDKCKNVWFEIEKLNSWITDVNEGQQMSYVFRQDEVEYFHNPKPLGKVKAPGLGRVLLQARIGPNPPNESLKMACLELIDSYKIFLSITPLNEIGPKLGEFIEDQKSQLNRRTWPQVVRIASAYGRCNLDTPCTYRNSIATSNSHEGGPPAWGPTRFQFRVLSRSSEFFSNLNCRFGYLGSFE